MTTVPIESNLAKITELSGSMLESANAGEWEQVQELEQQKCELIEHTFPLDNALMDVAAIIEYIQKIANLDKETMQLAATGRRELYGLLGKITAGQQAVTAYRNVGSK